MDWAQGSYNCQHCAKRVAHISRGHGQRGAFVRVDVIVASFMPTECPVWGGGGVMLGILEKPLKRGFRNTPGLH